jgi:Matrixin
VSHRAFGCEPCLPSSEAATTAWDLSGRRGDELGGGIVEGDGFGSDRSLDDIRRSPSGRVPQWVIDEALGVATPLAEPWRAHRSYPSASPRQTRGTGWPRWVKGLAVLLVLCLAVAVLLVVKPFESYKFIAKQADGKTPVAYSPCRAIPYVIRRQGEPVGGNELVVEAFSRVSEATGLHFVYEGATSESYSSRRLAHQPDRYGDRWAPILVTWVTRKEEPDLDGDTLGQGGSASVQVPDGQRVYVTGSVELVADKLARIQSRELNGKKVVQAVVMHELGHVVGLDHVNSRRQIMYPRNQRGVSDYGRGDLAGLAALGKGTCSSDR